MAKYRPASGNFLSVHLIFLCSLILMLLPTGRQAEAIVMTCDARTCDPILSVAILTVITAGGHVMQQIVRRRENPLCPAKNCGNADVA